MGTVNTTRIGRKWELWAQKYMFPDSKLITNINRNASYDIDLDGARINVKASKLFTKKHGKYFEFLLKHTHDGCDYFLCVGYRRWMDKNPAKVWLIPSCLVTGRYRITLGRNHAGEFKEFEREFVKRNISDIQQLKEVN